MMTLQFDPVTTELVIGRKTKKLGTAEGNSATLSALIVPTPLELQVNNLTIKDFVEITNSGTFTIFSQSIVEVR